MLNIANLSRPQNIGQAVDNDNNSINPYDNLNVANLSKPSDKQESQTISALYNLLQNNDIVRWDNNGNIKIRSPHGLTNIKKIKFRSFTGDLLPYTNLELPDLDISLKVFVSDALQYPVYLVGRDNTEGIIPKHIISNEQQQEQKDSSTICEFTKAWTYDNTKDSQIEYNIEELVKYLNECLLQWFGDITEKQVFGVINDEWVDYSFRYPIDDTSLWSYGVILTFNDKLASIPYIKDIDLKFKQIDFTSVGYNPINAVNVYPNGFVICEAGGEQWKEYLIYNLKTNSVGSEVFWGQCFDKFLTNRNVFPISVSNNYLIIWPYQSGASTTKPDIIIYRLSDNRSLTITNTDFNEYKKFTCCGLKEESAQYLSAYLIADQKVWDNRPTDLCILSINITISEDFTTGAATIITRNETALTYTDFTNQYMYPLKDGLYFDNSEVYETDLINGKKFISFGGQTIVQTYPTLAVRMLWTRKYNEQGNIYYLSNQEQIIRGNFNSVPLAKHYNIKDDNIIYNAFINGYIETSDMVRNYRPRSFPVKTIYNEDLTIEECYYQYPQLKNTSIMKIFNDFDCYYYSNAQPNYPKNCINEKITYNDVLFEYKDGTISFPSIYWSDTEFITFVPIITTKPKYFNIRFNIPQTSITPNKFSIVQTDTNIILHTLNEHVFTTLETLLLLKYEYNDLMLRCNNFPNNDNFVFSINESCEIDFKTMQANSNNQELNINLTDSNGEVIEYDTIKRLYGKVVLCIDWEG